MARVDISIRADLRLQPPPSHVLPTDAFKPRVAPPVFWISKRTSPPPPRVFIIFLFFVTFLIGIFFYFFGETRGEYTLLLERRGRRSMEGALNGWLASLFVRNLLLGGLDNLYNGTVVVFSYFLLDFFPLHCWINSNYLYCRLEILIKWSVFISFYLIWYSSCLLYFNYIREIYIYVV